MTVTQSVPTDTVPEPAPHEIAALAAELERSALPERILHASRLGRAVFTTSFGIEDQVLISAIAETAADVRVITLDTGRLFAETLQLMAETEARFGLEIEAFHPMEADIEAYAGSYGLNGFYDSLEARHACCDIRKMRPLGRALEGAQVWLTGIRRGQSANRAHAPLVEWDALHGLVKINPLADYSLEAIRERVRRDRIPVNPLHGRGYPSIGCEPCTRALRPGEPERAGRWWWENDEKRECGLHTASETDRCQNPKMETAP